VILAAVYVPSTPNIPITDIPRVGGPPKGPITDIPACPLRDNVSPLDIVCVGPVSPSTSKVAVNEAPCVISVINPLEFTVTFAAKYIPGIKSGCSMGVTINGPGAVGLETINSGNPIRAIF